MPSTRQSSRNWVGHERCQNTAEKSFAGRLVYTSFKVAPSRMTLWQACCISLANSRILILRLQTQSYWVAKQELHLAWRSQSLLVQGGHLPPDVQ